ncbi:MAG: tetratricopeptide repeat protein [Planctomycetota bacterium]|nr:tetratricopeptide repeat protein [Planctomycetota bacterium]
MDTNSERKSAWIQHAQSVEKQFQSLFQYKSLFSLHARLAFETKEKIGEGGMGTVYRVLDKRLGREAALKLLIASETEEKGELARERFLREAEITARLDHPAIPPVYEAGMASDGQLYMLMRLIRGGTLSEKIGAVHEDGEGSTRDLLEILVKVGEAMAYAHGQGVIHRDLKPSNIMVGGFGEVMVMDWGIAKDLKSQSQEEVILKSVLSNDEKSRAGLTGEGGVLGSLGYMSPEQLDGKVIDGTSDVFSLGLILVEALTGKRAIDGQTVVEIVAETLSGNITGLKDRPSKVRELNWICRKALALDPQERSTSEQFVEQLKSYLAGEKTVGYPYSALERVSRFTRRNAGKLTSLSLMLFLMMSFGNLWLSLENEREKSQRAELQSLLDVQSEAKRRRSAEKKTKETVEKLGVAEDEAKQAKEVLALFNRARGLINRGSPFETIDELLKEALKLGQRSKEQLLTAAQLYHDAGGADPATELLNEAIERFPPAYRALFQLSNIGMLRGDGTEFVLNAFQKILAESRKRKEVNEYTLFAEGSIAQGKEQLDEALRIYNKIPNYSTTFGPVYCNRGLILQSRGLLDEALADYNKAIELNPNDGRALNNRAILYKGRGQLEKALADYNSAVKRNPSYAEGHSNRGRLLAKMGEPEKAMSDYNKAIRIKPNYVIALVSRGSLKVKLGDRPGGMADYITALRIAPGRAEIYLNRGLLFQREKRYQEALRDFNKAIELKPSYSSAYNSRGYLWQVMRDNSKALLDYDQSLKYDSNNQRAYYNRGLLWQSQGQIQKGIDDYSRAIELNPRYIDAYNNRGILWHSKGDYRAALRDFDSAISLNPKLALAYANRAPAQYNVGRLEDAIADYEEFLKLAPNHRGVREVMQMLSRLRRELKARK